MAKTQEERFSIREHTRRIRVTNPEKCWPFDGVPAEVALLPPMTVRKFRWWVDELDEADKSVEASGGGDPEKEKVLVPESEGEKKKKKKKKKRGMKQKKTASSGREPVAWEGIIKAFTEVCGRTLEDMGPKKGSRRIWVKLWTHLQNSFQQNRKRPLAINDRGMPGFVNPLIQHDLHPAFLPLSNFEGFKSVLRSGQSNRSVSFSGRGSQAAGSQQSFEVGESSDQSLNPRAERESLNEDAPADDKTMPTTRFRGHKAIKKRKFL